MSSEPVTPEAAPPMPRATVRFLWVTAGVLALSLLLVIVAGAWPLPPACTASETPNPAWHSAVRTPVILANIGFVGSIIGAFCCFLGAVGAKGRRLAFLGLGGAAFVLLGYAAVVAFGIGLPCHAFY
jgi:hypothetical protein